MNNNRIISLTKSVNNSPESYLQFLLAIRKTKTLKRIIDCPTYPVYVKDLELQTMQKSFLYLLNKDRFQLSDLFGILYEKSFNVNQRKVTGSFFTPFRIAENAIKDTKINKDYTILDPGCGTGAFPSAILKTVNKNKLQSIKYLGIENDPILTLATAIVLDFLNAPLHWKILYSNFLTMDKEKLKKLGYKNIDLIICNPPYVRFQKLKGKMEINNKIKLTTGINLKGFSGVHSYFIALSSNLLSPKGEMVFFLPSEIKGGNYGSKLFKQLKEKFIIDVDIIDYNKIKNNKIIPKSSMMTRIYKFTNKPKSIELTLKENFDDVLDNNHKLRSIVTIHRGISTGHNNFFVLTDEKIKELKVDNNYLKKIIPTRIKMQEEVFSEKIWNEFRNNGKPCWLLTIPHIEKFEKLPIKLKEYIKEGVRYGIHLVPTCKFRKPWYSIPIPSKGPPDFVFTYISRNPRFVYNEFKGYYLTNLLGLYILNKNINEMKIKKEITFMLNNSLKNWIPRDNINSVDEPVGRLYSPGLRKFEPGDLKKMPIKNELWELLSQ